MTRLIGPDEASRTVFLTAGSNKGKAAAQGMAVPLYADSTLSTPADVRSTTDAVIAGTPPTVTVDAYSQIPLFKFPDGADTVYTSINGGPPVALYARTDDRLDTLAARLTAVEAGSGGGGGGAVASVAGKTGVVTLVAGDVSGVETPAGAQAKADAAQAAAATDATSKVNTASSAAISTAAADATAKANAVAAASLPKTGGTMTGPIILPGNFRLPLVQPSYRRPRWRDASGYFENFQIGHGWVTNGGGTAASNLNDTSVFVRGTQSVSITSSGAGTGAAIRKTGITGLAALDLTDKMFRVVLRVESGLAALNNLNFFLGTSSLANNFKWVLNPTTNSSAFITQGQWVTVTFGWGDLNSATGTMSISNGVPSTRTGFTDMQIQATDLGAGTGVQLRVQSVEIIDATTTTFPKGVISVTFDDSWSSQWDLARPAMDTFGFRGTQYTIADSLGTPGHLTLDQLQRLQGQSGWEVGGHAYTSAAHTARLPTMTAAAVDQEIGSLKAWLLQNGFDGDSFAYPGGQFEQTSDGVWVEDICARYFSSNRSILAQPQKAVETFPAPMPHRLRAISGVSSLNNSNGLNNPAGIVAAGGILDKIVAGGGWLIMCFHLVTAGAPSVTTEIAAADFATIMQGIADRGIPVLPVSDVIRHYA